MSCLALAALLNLVRFGFVQLCVAVFELSCVANFCVGWLGYGSIALLALRCDLWLSFSSLLRASLTLVAADVFAADISLEERTTYHGTFGKTLDCRKYMAIERLFCQAAEVNKEFGPVATLPPCFDYGIGCVWQGMSCYRFREFTNFSTTQERNHRVAEQLLNELDTMLLSYCIKGCPQPCVNEERDVAGLPVTPLLEQFYYHFQGQIVVIVVSRKPT